jgi:hypothetical protein
MAILMRPREKIVRDFSEWTAFSAIRSGKHPKSKKEIYPLIRLPDYQMILTGKTAISQNEFDTWHEKNTTMICQAAPALSVGWATKLINVYLKTRVYTGNEGRPDLIRWIHPPIDGGLWAGIWAGYHNNSSIVGKTHVVRSIKEIKTYECYKTIIEGCALIARERGCLLIEVEELWQGTKI